MYCLQACMNALFSPEILQAGAVKGLNKTADIRFGKKIIRNEKVHSIVCLPY